MRRLHSIVSQTDPRSIAFLNHVPPRFISPLRLITSSVQPLKRPRPDHHRTFTTSIISSYPALDKLIEIMKQDRSVELQNFFDRNEEFVAQSDKAQLTQLSQGQSPNLFWLGCSDSRVPESLVIRAGLGEVFVHRNVANLFTPGDTSATAALAYAINHLKVSHVVVVGHEQCGGCAAGLAAAQTKQVTPTCDVGERAIGEWIEPIKLLATAHLEKEPKTELSSIVKANVCAQVHNLVNHSVIQKAWARGQPVSVHGWIYDLASGKLDDLDVTRTGP